MKLIFLAGWVKLKWKNLRDTYCRILKYKNKSPQGLRRKKWIFEDHLSFLKFPYQPNYETQYVELTEDYINDINKEVINSQELLEQLEDNDEDDDYSEYLDIPEENVILKERCEKIPSENNDTRNILSKLSDDNTSQLNIDEYAKKIQSKFRKIRPKREKIEYSNNISTFSPVIINNPAIIPIHKQIIVQNSDNVNLTMKALSQKNIFSYKDNIDSFFNNMAHTVKKLPPKAQTDIKMDICSMVSEAEIHHSRENASQNIQKHTNISGIIPKMVLVPCHMIDNQNKSDKT